jgi:hypothetical protein
MVGFCSRFVIYRHQPIRGGAHPRSGPPLTLPKQRRTPHKSLRLCRSSLVCGRSCLPGPPLTQPGKQESVPQLVRQRMPPIPCSWVASVPRSPPNSAGSTEAIPQLAAAWPPNLFYPSSIVGVPVSPVPPYSAGDTGTTPHPLRRTRRIPNRSVWAPSPVPVPP